MRKSRKAAVKLDSDSLLQQLILILKGAAIAIIITLLCIIIFAFIMQLASLQESIIRPVVQVVKILSIAMGGAYVARACLTRGWLKGAITGIFYVILASLVAVLTGGSFAFDAIFLSDIVMAVFVGAIGGAIGINIK